jgi:hypothetical protein
MGTLKYDGTTTDFDDRVLAHVQLAVIQKLRRQESFSLAWLGPEAGGGRTTIWVHPAANITFHFSDPVIGPIDRAWADKLIIAAGSPGGMFVMDADGKPIPSADTTTFG